MNIETELKRGLNVNGRQLLLLFIITIDFFKVGFLIEIVKITAD